MKANSEIRDALEAADIKYWELASQLRISPSTLTVWLRHELPSERKRLVLNAVWELSQSMEGGKHDGLINRHTQRGGSYSSIVNAYYL